MLGLGCPWNLPTILEERGRPGPGGDPPEDGQGWDG